MDEKSLKNLGIISLEELGIDTSNYCININDLYSFVVDLCHQRPVDFNQIVEKTTSSASDEFSAYGRVANFDWVALTQLYSSTLFTALSEDKKTQNAKNSRAIAMGFQLGQYLSQAIQNSSMLRICLNQRNFVVPDTSDLAWDGIHEHTHHMAIHIRNFLGLKWDSGPKLGIEDNHLVAKEGSLSDLKGKDVILPFIYANNSSINLYGQIANIICNFANANTANGIFITRIMPTMDGKEPNSLAQYEYVPIISPFFGMEIPPLGY